MNDNMLSNLIKNWKRTSNRFTKLCIFNNKFDYENRLILREYQTKIILSISKFQDYIYYSIL